MSHDLTFEDPKYLLIGNGSLLVTCHLAPDTKLTSNDSLLKFNMKSHRYVETNNIIFTQYRLIKLLFMIFFVVRYSELFRKYLIADLFPDYSGLCVAL